MVYFLDSGLGAWRLEQAIYVKQMTHRSLPEFPSEKVRKVRLRKVKAKITQLVSDRTRI